MATELFLSIGFPPLIGGVVGWWVYRRLEASPPSSGTDDNFCSAKLEEAQRMRDASGGMREGPWIGLLEQYHRRCGKDYSYVSSLATMLSMARQWDYARDVLKKALGDRAAPEDVVGKDLARIDLDEAHEVNEGEEERQRQLRERAISVGRSLVARWPEWSDGYSLLRDTGDPDVPTHMQQGAISRNFWKGAWIRGLDPGPIAFLSALGISLGLWASAVAFYGHAHAAFITQTPTSSIATARPGNVELKGVLALPDDLAMLSSPLKKEACLWYSYQWRDLFGKQKSSGGEISKQFLLVRDETGSVLLDPAGAQIVTRHSIQEDTSSPSRRHEEEVLKVGDPVYVLGELVESSESGMGSRIVRRPADGRALHVNVYGEANELFVSRFLGWMGVMVALVCGFFLGWSHFQRYRVAASPWFGWRPGNTGPVSRLD